jgi:glycosyltransferase involved in cell wall biosynthesis
LASRLLKVTARRARTAIAISDAVAKDIGQVLPFLPVTTILNAIDLQEFSPGRANGGALDTLSGMPSAPEGTVRIGLIATYARWKGQAVFLQAAARVCASMPKHRLRFYIVGGPIYATGASQFSVAELRELIAELHLQDTAGLIPFQANLLEIYRGLDVVVHSSTRAEPFGRSIVEAMACARPTVVSAAGGAKELVRPGITGLIHSPADVDGLASAIERLVRSPELRAGLGNAARNEACKRFARNRLGPSLVNVYNSLLGGG